MFAVPGWSVPSSELKTQTFESLEKAHRPSISKESQSTVVPKPGKKRKRGHSISKPSDVSSANFGALWETVIEKKNDARNNKSGRKREKKETKASEVLQDRVSSILIEEDSKKKSTIDTVDKRAGDRDNKANKEEPIKPNRSAKRLERELYKHAPTSRPPAQLTPLQTSMRQKLISARFRYLNEILYTKPSTDSFELFQQNPEMFQEYHEGFRRQVQIWPENPVDRYVEQIALRGTCRSQARAKIGNTTIGMPEQLGLEAFPLPRSNGVCHVADMGCGDATLSLKLENMKKKLKLQVFSYDLQSPNSLVTKADIADLPLGDGSIDVAIFCLALMGTNWIDFIEEAFRILRWKGELWIAEIKSRFGRTSGNDRRVDHSVGNRKKTKTTEAKMIEQDNDDADLLVRVDGQEDKMGETDVSAFVEVLSKRGFILRSEKGVDVSNKMVVTMSFVKAQTPIKGKCVPVPKGMAEIGLDTWKKKFKATSLDDKKLSPGNEASTLKPCVYKLR